MTNRTRQSCYASAPVPAAYAPAASIAVAAVAALLFLAPTTARAQSYAVEGLDPALPLLGQDGWYIPTGAASAAAVVDNTNFSPLGGSTQSIKFRGNGQMIRIAHNFPSTLSTGAYRVSYDLSVTTISDGENLVARVADRTSAETSLFQPYAQDGGGGIAQNGFEDPDGLGPALYQGYGDIVQDAFRYTANHWYRFAYTMDLSASTLSDFAIYDINAGTLSLIAAGTNTYYLQNDGTNFIHDWHHITVGLDTISSSAGWNFDNFSVIAVPEPVSLPLLLLPAAALLPRHRRARSL